MDNPILNIFICMGKSSEYKGLIVYFSRWTCFLIMFYSIKRVPYVIELHPESALIFYNACVRLLKLYTPVEVRFSLSVRLNDK